MERNTYQQIKATAPLSGSLVGLMWIASFVCVTNATTNPLLSLFGLGLGFGSLISAGYMGYSFRWKACNGQLSFTGQWLMSMMTLLYACILMAAGIFLYMRFLDSGRFAQVYKDLLEIPEQKAVIDSMLAESGMTAEEMVNTISNYKPIDFALQTTGSNLIMSILISPILALAARIRKPSVNR